MLSGLACMYYQSPSLLEFQRQMETLEQRNNLRSLFKVQNLPTDQGMRNVIDQVDTDTAFRPIFKDLFNKYDSGLKNQDKILQILFPIIKLHF